MKIIQIKQVGQLFQIVFDDGQKFLVSASLVLDYGLTVNKLFEQDIFSEFEIAALIDKNYLSCLNLINYRQRTTKEIKTYLAKFNLDQSIIESIIKKLKQNNFLNDNRFIEAFINDSLNLNLRSIKMIKLNLLKKGFKKADIDAVLVNYSDEEVLKKLILKKQKISSYKNSQKLINYLINRGFDYQQVKSVLANQ